MGKFEELERVQYYACKRFMCCKQNASNVAVLGDCGRYPMYIISIKRCINYWLKIIKMPNNRLVKKCYLMMFNDDIQGHDNWVTSLRKNLQSHGFGYVWESQSVTSEKYFI
jgi:hypothetical protein